MSEITFKSKKADPTFTALYLLIAFLLLGAAALTLVLEDTAEAFLPMGIISGFLLFLMFASQKYLYIKICGERLSVFFFFKVYSSPIKNITKIRKGETMWSGLHKYGTTTKGLIVFASYANDLYITPENEANFIECLQKINPSIKFETVN